MYLSDRQLAKKFDVHRTAIWRWVKKSDFPKPVRLSGGCTRWLDAEVQEWEKRRMGQRAEA